MMAQLGDLQHAIYHWAGERSRMAVLDESAPEVEPSEVEGFEGLAAEVPHGVMAQLFRLSTSTTLEAGSKRLYSARFRPQL